MKKICMCSGGVPTLAEGHSDGIWVCKKCGLGEYNPTNIKNMTGADFKLAGVVVDKANRGKTYDERERIWKLIEGSEFVRSALDAEGFEYYYKMALNNLKKEIFFEKNEEGNEKDSQ